MHNYSAPLKEMRFVMKDLAGLEEVCALPGHDDIDVDTVDAVIEEGAKFAAEVLAPLNESGDRQGATMDDNGAVQADGFKEAYHQYIEGGWSTMPCEHEFGGMGMPHIASSAVSEMWASSNLSFSIGPMLSIGAISALQKHSNDTLKQTYLPKMISGEWTGTMNLTEPQAGSDLAAVRTKAEPNGDHYLITGTKIYISWGDHQMTDNIIHLVLARTPDAPKGVKGISMFVVPKFHINDDGSCGERNDVICSSIEHKMGIHASPTCVMNYGEKGGATGYLVGEENQGLKYMFTMMNAARLHVGIEGVALGESAYQHAVRYAKERVQGAPLGQVEPNTIIKHGDIRRMLMLMRSLNEAGRAINYFAAASLDHGEKGDTAAYSRLEFLTPIAKGWATEVAQEVTSLGLQIHGGMGFVEETGAAQYMRDARIITIYEGTTGIQALDLIGRKILRDGGKELMGIMAEVQSTLDTLKSDHPALSGIAEELGTALQQWQHASQDISQRVLEDIDLVGTSSVNYLMLSGTVLGGWLLAKSAMIAEAKMATDEAFFSTKIATANFFASHVLPRASAFAKAAVADSKDVMGLDEELF